MTTSIRSITFMLFLTLVVAIPLSAQSGSGNGQGSGGGSNSPDTTAFGLRIFNQSDTAFNYTLARYTTRRTRGGIGQGKNWAPLFSGYDSSMVRFTDVAIVPLKAGRTPLVVTYNPHRDTIALVIEQVGRNLVVDFDRESLRAARMASLYHVDTWDTAGGAARTEAMGRITIGMPIDEALALMNSRDARPLENLPGTFYIPVELQRGIYIEVNEGRVAKVWIGSRESGSRESGSRESGSRESGSRESGSRESRVEERGAP